MPGFRFRHWLAGALALVLLPACAGAAQAEKRIALLIGNQAYSAEIGRLANPHNDVALLERTLKALQFEVTVVRDASLSALHQAVNQHVRRVRSAGTNAVGLLYYSGHGAADATTGINYLIPVDVKSADDGELWDASLQLTEVTRKLRRDAGNATHFVVFDACRNALKIRKAGTRTLLQSKGFVPVAQENGMLIAYATAEGELASDVGDGAGPYAKVLAEEIAKPGVEAVVMFRAVQRRVRAAIGQEPYLGFSALGDIYLAGAEPPRPPPVAAPQTPTSPRLSEAAEAWDRTKDMTSIAVLEAFIFRFQDTFFADLARARIEEVKKKQQVAIAVPPPKASAPAPKAAEPAVAITPTPPPSRCDGVEALVSGRQHCLKPKDSFKDCPDCPEMVMIPAGSFMMGSPASEERYQTYDGREEPQRTVTIARPFAAGRFEVTFAEWDACVAAGGCKHKPNDHGWGSGKQPVIDVSWDDAKEYIAWLSKKVGTAYRLLSEAEWEYAARAGTTTPFSTGATITSDQANFNGEYTYGGSAKGQFRQRPVEVGTFKPNAFGLHDMHGNVWEWVEDCWRANYKGAPADGSAWVASSWVAPCSDRVLRGGSWFDFPQDLRSADRVGISPAYRGYLLGFRVARTL